MEIKWNSTIIKFNIVYSKRKSIGIHLNEEGEVTVRAPRGIDYKTIEKIVLKKASWINKKILELKEKQINIRPKEFVDGELFLYMGKEIPLKIVHNYCKEDIAISFKGEYIKIKTSVSDKYNLKNALEKWYRRLTKDFVNECVEHYGKSISKHINRIVIKEQKSRWGSCSSKNNLNFNWRLSMAPAEVLEYVVVHEMCHLVHMNHSKEFWSLVENFIPDYKTHREWLKINGRKLYAF